MYYMILIHIRKTNLNVIGTLREKLMRVLLTSGTEARTDLVARNVRANRAPVPIVAHVLHEFGQPA